MVSQALEAAGIAATLSGGAAVSIFTDNEYESYDLDFVSSARAETIEATISPLGFRRARDGRHFEHANTEWLLEFPPGPLAFGDVPVREGDMDAVATEYGPLRIVSPTQIVMDRVAAYAHWRDRQSLDQAAPLPPPRML